MQAPQTDLAAIIDKLVSNSDPRWALAALSISIGLPIFLVRLPATIKAISAYHDTYRKTSHKIGMDRVKLKNAVDDRNNKPGKAKGGKE